MGLGMLKDLKSTGLYEIYALYPEGCDLKFKAAKMGVNVITIPTITKEIIYDMEDVITLDVNNPFAIFKMIKIEVTELFRSEKLLLQLKALNFDMYIHGVAPHSIYLNNYLQIPIMMKVIDCQPESSLQPEIGGHVLQSSVLGALTLNIFGINQVLTNEMTSDNYSMQIQSLSKLQSKFIVRFENFLVQFLWRSAGLFTLRQYFQRNLADQFKQYVWEDIETNFTLFYGVHGMFTPTQLSSNSRIIYPKYKQQFNEDEKKLDFETLKFLEKYDKIVYVSFGTLLKPSNKQLDEIQKASEAQENYGFIFSLKDQEIHNQETIQKLKSQKNVLLKSWVPQPTLLKHPNIKIQLSHGGLNSVLEAAENLIPLIISPLQGIDQPINCEVAHAQQIAICLRQYDAKLISKAIEILESQNYFREKLEKVRKVMMRQQKDEKDLAYWVDYVFDVGTDAMMAHQFHYFSVFELFDIDVYFSFLMLLVVLLVKEQSMGLGLGLRTNNLMKLKGIRSAENYGFIFSLKDQEIHNQETIQKLKSQKNVLLKSWVPQPTLLKHPNIKIQLSHGGLNSVLEAAENLIPLIISPLQGIDQPINCEVAHAQQIAICLRQYDAKLISKAIEILESQNYFREKLEKVRKVMMRQQKDEKDLAYWVDYVFDVGTDAMMAHQFHYFSVFELFDIDVYFSFLMLLVVLLYISWKIILITLKVLKYIQKRQTISSKKIN
eukprot:403361040